MIPIHLIFLSLLVMLYTTPGVAGMPRSGPAHPGAGLVLGTVIGSHLVLALVVWLNARRTARLLHAGGEHHIAAYRFERLLGVARWATLALAFLQLWGLGWGELVMSAPARGGWGIDNRFLALPELILMAPAIVTWIVFWLAHYSVERAVRERAMPYRLAMALPVHELPSRGAYAFMQMRHNLYLLIPLAVASSAEKLVVPGPSWLGHVVPVAVIVLVFLLLPWMVTRVWRTRPMTGPLRQRLDTLAAEHGVRFQDIVVWHTHHMLANAAILGYLPFARYFLMSDALLEQLTDRQIEAVFAHEVGHGRHRHVWWYVATIAAGTAITASVTTLVLCWIDHRQGLNDEQVMQMGTVLQLTLMFGYFFVCFFPISRRFEHQADWFAARHMANSLQREPEVMADTMTIEQYMGTLAPAPAIAEAAGPVEAAAAPVADRTERLTRGAEMFSSALQQIVSLAHRSTRRGGLFHPSVENRVHFLYNLAASESAAAAFERRMIRTRVLITLLLIAGIGLAVVTEFLL